MSLTFDKFVGGSKSDRAGFKLVATYVKKNSSNNDQTS